MNNGGNYGGSGAVMDRDQVVAALRRIITEADEYFVQQQKLLKLSYTELNCKIEQLRYKAQYASVSPSAGGSTALDLPSQYHTAQQQQQQQAHASRSSPIMASPFSVSVHNATTTAVQSSAGITGGGGVNGLSNPLNNATPLRAPSFSTAGARAAFPSSVPQPSSLPSAFNTTNTGSALDSSGTLLADRLNFNGTSTPPSHHFGEDQFADWAPAGARPATGTASSSGGGYHVDSLMASPQATGKMTLEELLAQLGSTSDHPPPPNCLFDSLYEPLVGREDSPGDGSDTANAGSANVDSSATRNGAGEAGRGVDGRSSAPETTTTTTIGAGLDALEKNVIPIDTLRAMHDQHLTTSVKTVYENGRPRVVPIVDGADDDPSALGVDVHASCQVLVEFKRKRVMQHESAVFVSPGSYVVVGGDRGEDLGLVIYTWCETTRPGQSGSPSATPMKRGKEGGRNTVVGVGLTGSTLTRSIGVGTGTVLRLATESEVSQLHGVQTELERRAIDVCSQQVLEHGLPMVIVDAEYQFDKKKLTFFYEAQQRMDFRELVRDLYKTFRARIWMEMVDV